MPVIPKALAVGSNNFMKFLCIFAVETGLLHLGIHYLIQCAKFNYEYILFSSVSQVLYPEFLILVNVTYSHLSKNPTDINVISDSFSSLSRRIFALDRVN